MKTFADVIQLLIQVNQDLIDDKISIDKAKQIATNTQVIINAAKLEFEYINIMKIESDFFKTTKQLESSIKNISMMYLKGLFNLSEQEADSFFKFCTNKNIKTISEFGDGKKLYAEWSNKNK